MKVWEEYRESLAGRRVLVAGAGRSGLAAARLLTRIGAGVLLLDEDPARPGAMRPPAIRRGGPWDLAVVSPGVGPDSPLYREIEGLGIPVHCETELGYRCSPWPVVAVTGTNGKTTTVRLIESILAGAGARTAVAGNIGRPLSSVVDEGPSLDCVVLEASSFQLERVDRFRPRVAVLLNLVPDHLDRHRSFENYCRAKARLLANMGEGDVAVIQKEAAECLARHGIPIVPRPLTFSTRSREASLFLRDGRIGSDLPGWRGDAEVPGGLRGAHNAENLMAALLVARVLGIETRDALASLRGFRGESHRMEVIFREGGMVAIDDSKSTNPDSLRAAIGAAREMVAAHGRLWVVAGGDSKGLPFRDLALLVDESVDGLYLYGADRDRMRDALGGLVFEGIESASEAAFQSAAPGDVVLFSPGCASFDQFRNYAERGERFRSLALGWSRRIRQEENAECGAIRRGSLPVVTSTEE